MRRCAVLGVAVLVLSGCSPAGGSVKNEEIPPKPLARELCDAIGAERIEKIVPGARTTQAKDVTGVGALTGVADASCNAQGAAFLRVVYRRYGQTASQTPTERVTQAVDESCDDMRSGRWAVKQAKIYPGFRADPMDPPGTGIKGTCKISGRYDVLEIPVAKVLLVFGLKGDLVEVELTKDLSESARLNDSLVTLMTTEVTALATDLFGAKL